jgi:hypothetical protein
MGAIKQFDSLSTSYVNLGALIRHLRAQNFMGAIRVAFDQYAADVFLEGQEPVSVLEIDPATRRASKNEGAMDRLLVHAREPGGAITVYEGRPRVAFGYTTEAYVSALENNDEVTETAPPPEDVDWDDLLEAGGKLVGAVERAAQNLGADFDANFRAACIELGDDYPFLDPTGNGLAYAQGVLTFGEQPSSNAFVTALSEALRRIVNKLAIGKEGKRFRESVAIELAVAARMRAKGMGQFTPQLDRIAGTRVL